MDVLRVYLDVDGILVQDDGTVGHQTALAVAASAVPISIVTARAPFEMQRVWQTIQLPGPHVYFNGALVLLGTQVLADWPLPRRTAEKWILGLRQAFPSLTISCYDLTHWYSDRFDERIDNDQRIMGGVCDIVSFDALLTRATSRIYKVMIVTRDETEMAEVLSYVARHQDGDVQAWQSGGNYLEFTHQLANKAQGAAVVAAFCHESLAQSAAVGDGHNDLLLFAEVQCAVAMGNAAPAVQAQADEITKDCNHDGVAAALEMILRK